MPPRRRSIRKKLLIAGVAALTAKLAAGNPLCALAVGLAAVVAAVLREQLLGGSLLAT